MTPDIAARWPKADVRHVDRTWIPAFCARCHADPNFMPGFNPSLPTDQLSKYRESQHGILLLQQKDSKAAQCVSCHGVHGIRGPKSRQSSVHPQAVPETCGHCHADPKYMAGYKKDDGTPLPTDQLAGFKKSVHGKALLEKGDLGAPACNSCHGNHAAMPPKVSSISQVCRTCHSQNGTFFDGSKHKQAFEAHHWPECEKCHGKHEIAKTTDMLISDAPDGLCGACHAENARDNPECNATARYFRSSLTDLVGTRERLRPEAEELATRGLDAEPILASLEEVGEAIVQTRSRVHTFDRGGFESGGQGRAGSGRQDGDAHRRRPEGAAVPTHRAPGLHRADVLPRGGDGNQNPPARPASRRGRGGSAQRVRVGRPVSAGSPDRVARAPTLREAMLLLEAAGVLDERVGLLRRHLVLERWHDLLAVLLHAVEDGLLEVIVLLALVRGGAHVLDLELLALVGVALAGLTVAGGALGLPRALGLLGVGLCERRGAEENCTCCHRRQETDVLHGCPPR